MTNPTLSRSNISAEERHANGRKIRREALPEYAHYQDVGCSLAPSCLSCPFIRCRYDLPVEQHVSPAQLQETSLNERKHREP